MRIVDFDTFVVGTPPPHFGGRYWVFLKLVTDDGIEGFGEAYAAPFLPQTTVAMLADVCERHVVNSDPFRIEHLWRVIYADGYTQRADLSVMAVLSAVEMACWDILGKSLNVPVHAMLGGEVHSKLRAYTYLYPEPDDAGDVYQDADFAVERAVQYVEAGFTAVKFDPVGPYSAYDPRQLSLDAIARTEQFVSRLRGTLGDRCDLLIGTHGQMTPTAALRLAQRLEPYQPLWLEEPVPPENEIAMAEVARGTTIPIATGERLATKYDFHRVLRAGAASILQMNLGRVGGILEAKKIAGMAEAHYVQIAPHMYCGPVVWAANIQLAVCSPNFLIQESIYSPRAIHAKIVKSPIQIENGFILPPKAPGLGVELDESAMKQYPYDDAELHLQVAPDPML